jgi:hypothetical protein
MTDLSPNVEVVLSSDLFDDDPCLESMSAPALVVLGAYMSGYGWLDGPTKKDCRGVAAALRAAAPLMEFVQDHQKLLAIAAELEAHS